ncbi:hypothetical protein P5643_13960 [Bacillus subtilis]|nr:hypothetical protein P5643_13960 [Bacillus subtilis]
MNRLNKEQLEEIRKRSEKATEGFWNADSYEWPGNENLRYWVNTLYDGLAAAVTKEDADFIANARQDIPALLNHIAELEAELAENKISFLSYEESQKDLARRCAERGVTKGYPLYDYYEGGDEDDNV